MEAAQQAFAGAILAAVLVQGRNSVFLKAKAPWAQESYWLAKGHRNRNLQAAVAGLSQDLAGAEKGWNFCH